MFMRDCLLNWHVVGPQKLLPTSVARSSLRRQRTVTPGASRATTNRRLHRTFPVFHMRFNGVSPEALRATANETRMSRAMVHASSRCGKRAEAQKTFLRLLDDRMPSISLYFATVLRAIWMP